MKIQCINIVEESNGNKCSFCKKIKDTLHINAFISLSSYHLHICDDCFRENGKRK